MRQIKFRGLRTDGKGWVYGDLKRVNDNRFGGQWTYIWVDTHETEDSGEEIQVEPHTVGQFTGVKDQDGQDIFEGDKVHFDATPYSVGGLKTDGVIVNNKGSWAIKYQCRWTSDLHYMYYNFSCEDFVGKKSKIIGNTHTQDGGQEG